MKYYVSIPNKPESIYSISDIINHIKLKPKTRRRVTIVLTEIFENINHHSSAKNIKLSIRKRSNRVSILLIFNTKNFEVLIQKIKNPRIYFSNHDKRYRGLGVRMCHNISSSIMYKYSNRCVKILIFIDD
ncbi:MAG: hypothetical protein N2712_04600 [Brevinematales bacterium]|nr:hypothetical protein [Brevinematales bacterium]